MTDVATAEATAEQTEATEGEGEGEGEVQADGTGKSKRNTLPIQITVPLDLKAIIKAKADEAGLTEARWVLENIAGDLEYTLAPAKERGGATRPGALFPKGLTPEAKKERFDAARTLLAALDKGELDLDDIKRRLGLVPE